MAEGTDASVSPGRRWSGVAVFVLAVVVAAGAALWAFRQEETSAAGMLESFRPAIGERAPDFALPDARNPDRVLHLSDFHGRPIILNWYASWCRPCRDEIPDFLKAQETLGEHQLVILGVDLQEPADRAVEILDELGATYPAVLDTNGDVYAHYLITARGMPVTYFIDADGILRDVHTGRVDEDRLVEALAAIGLEYEPPAEE